MSGGSHFGEALGRLAVGRWRLVTLSVGCLNQVMGTGVFLPGTRDAEPMGALSRTEEKPDDGS